MGFYRKKPAVIEAKPWLPSWPAYSENVINWLAKTNVKFSVDGGLLHIMTLEGKMTAVETDMIIKGVAGEFYPCKIEIFDETYEALNHP